MRVVEWARAKPWQALAAASVVYIVAGLVLSLLFDGPLDVTKVGNLGEWAAGMGAFAAVSVALWQTTHQLEELRRQREEERDDNRRRLLREVTCEMAQNSWRTSGVFKSLDVGVPATVTAMEASHSIHGELPTQIVRLLHHTQSQCEGYNAAEAWYDRFVRIVGGADHQQYATAVGPYRGAAHDASKAGVEVLRLIDQGCFDDASTIARQFMEAVETELASES